MNKNASRLILILGTMTILVGVYQAFTGDPFSDYLMPLVIGGSLIVAVYGIKEKDSS